MADDEVTGAPETAERSSPVGRRVFLGLLGIGTVGVFTGSTISNWLQRIAKDDKTGLLGILPGGGGWRYYTVTDGYPSRSPSAYSLRVSGLVDQPFTLTYEQLKAMPPTKLNRDFQCVTGWRVLGVKWRGVRVADLLDRAGVKPEGKALRLTSFDGTYTESLTLDQARRNDVIVAYELDGKPVSSDHGGPVRLYVAPMYGYKSVKWLDGIEVVDKVIPGYWEDRGYDIDAWVGESNGRNDEQT
ncbi:MAG: molybdopterin-dependent oxidoreductase [Acidimicrobiia bacterium]